MHMNSPANLATDMRLARITSYYSELQLATHWIKLQLFMHAVLCI